MRRGRDREGKWRSRGRRRVQRSREKRENAGGVDTAVYRIELSNYPLFLDLSDYSRGEEIFITHNLIKIINFYSLEKFLSRRTRGNYGSSDLSPLSDALSGRQSESAVSPRFNPGRPVAVADVAPRRSGELRSPHVSATGFGDLFSRRARSEIAKIGDDDVIRMRFWTSLDPRRWGPRIWQSCKLAH